MTIEEANEKYIPQKASSDVIRPCPFCGEQPYLQDFAGWEVNCECGASVVNEPEYELCVKRWNARANGWKRLQDEKPRDGQECIIFKSHCYWVGTWFEESQTFSGGVQSDLWMPVPLAPGDEE